MKVGVEFDDMDCIWLAQDEFQYMAFVCTVMKVEGSIKVQNVLII
jgi:hypothetical protein